MINFAKIRQLIFESYEARLISRGVSSDIIEYIASLNSSDRGGVIAKVMSNPKLSLDDVRLKEKFRVKNNAQHQLILNADPTPDKSYYEILAKWFTVDKTISLPNDTERTTEVLDYYNKNKRRFVTSYVTKYKTFQELEQEYITVSGKKSKRQEIKDIKVDGSTKIYENSTWVVYAVTTHAAACFYGSGTTWCTASNKSSSAFDGYAQDGPLKIFINKKTSEKYQASVEYDEFRDAKDEPVYHPRMAGMTLAEFGELMYVAYDVEMNMKDKKHAHPEEVIQMMMNRDIPLPKGALGNLIKDAVKYPEENVILLNSLTLKNTEIMNGAYKKEVDFILSHDIKSAVSYWLNRLKSKSVYHELEQRIFKDHLNSVASVRAIEFGMLIKYAEAIYPRGWKKLEEVLVDRFDEAEKGQLRYNYTFENFVYEYITRVRKSRWEEAENFIQTSTRMWSEYYGKFKNEMKDEYGLDRLLKIGQWIPLVEYAINTEKKRIPEFEKLVLKSLHAYNYGSLNHEEKNAMRELKKYIMHFKIKGPLPHALIDQLIKNMRELISGYGPRADQIIKEILDQLVMMQNLMTGHHPKEIVSSFIRADYNLRKTLMELMRFWLPWGKRWIEFEDYYASILKRSADVYNPETISTCKLILSYMEALEITKQRIHPVLEETIGQLPILAAEYSVAFLKSRFPIKEVHDRLMLASDHNTGSPNSLVVIRKYQKLYG